MEQKLNYEALLSPLGGRLRRDRSDEWWELQSGDFVLELELGWRYAGPRFRLGIGCAVSHKGLSVIVNRLLGKPSSVPQSFRYDQRRIEVDSLDGLGPFYRKLVEAEIEDVQKTNIQQLIKEFAANCPDKPSMPQLMHLASLAWLGDFSTLTEYKKIFQRGYRLNFVPMITQEMIDRAIEVAFERIS